MGQGGEGPRERRQERPQSSRRACSARRGRVQRAARSINEASRRLDIASGKIREKLCGQDDKGRNTYSVKGFVFAYASEPADVLDLNISQARLAQGCPRSVVAVHAGGERRVFDSSKDAAKALGVGKASISKVITGRMQGPLCGWVLTFHLDLAAQDPI